MNKKIFYPAVFHENNDCSFTVIFPDLPGCITEGKTLSEAINMAHSALAQWSDFLIKDGNDVPAASKFEDVHGEEYPGGFVKLIELDADALRPAE